MCDRRSLDPDSTDRRWKDPDVDMPHRRWNLHPDTDDPADVDSISYIVDTVCSCHREYP